MTAKNIEWVTIEHPNVQNQSKVTREAYDLTWSQLGWTIAENARVTAPEVEDELPFDLDDPELEDDVLADNEGE